MNDPHRRAGGRVTRLQYERLGERDGTDTGRSRVDTDDELTANDRYPAPRR